MADDISQSTGEKASRSLVDRWAHEELFDSGFVGIPVQFLELYSQLKPPLTSGEAMFVIQLMSYKWGTDAPFPGYAAIARRMGVSDKAVRRHAAALENKKYLTRIRRIGSTNKFDLSALFDALKSSHLTFRRRSNRRRGEGGDND